MADYIGGISFKRGDGGNPETFTKVPGLASISGLGKTNPLADSTDFDSAAKEYIAGLPDGDQITLEFNDDLDGSTNTQLAGLISDVDSGTNRNVQVVFTDGTNTETYDFTVVPLSWKKVPSVTGVNRVQITIKISGAITKS